MTMEPNNIENQIKQKLESRTIQPSAQAWDRLDAMLTVAEKPKRNFNWMYIAASFIGFVFIATVYLSQTEPLIDVPKNNVVIGVPKAKTQMQDEAVLLEKTNKEVLVAEENSKIKQSNSVLVYQSKTVESKKIKNQNTQVSIINQKAIANNQNQETQKEVFINKQQILINTEPIKPNYVNVDELLAAAEAPSPSKNVKVVNNKSVVSVNANNLLDQVDGELELTFRQSVIKTVSKKYQTVKVALSNRNQE